MELADILDRAHVVALPMAVRFRGITTREALLIDGPAGWGEFAPFLEYGDEESAAWLSAGLEAAYQGYQGLDLGDRAVRINGTVPAVAASEVEGVLARFPGVDTFKIKVAEKGQTLIDDLARLAAVHTHHPDAELRVDANGGWSVDEAVQAAEALADAAGGMLRYIEQPCKTVEELVEVRRRSDVPVAADESIRKAADPYRVAELDAADVAVTKVAPLGGVGNTLTIAKDLAAHNMSITVASALDTAVGIGVGLIAAKAVETAVGANAAGLGTQRLFVEDVAERQELRNGCLEATPCVPDPDRLAELAAPGERKDFWFDRLRRCWDILSVAGGDYDVAHG
nr:o-succinylbenzoate synthase [Corynebacterium meitnerae]